MAQYLQKYDLFNLCIDWLKEHHTMDTLSLQAKGKTKNSRKKTFIEKLEHMMRKLAMGLGYWDDSMRDMGDYFSAVISKNIAFAIHPTEDRFFSVRELLHLMGMPHNFQLNNPKKNLNHHQKTR